MIEQTKACNLTADEITVLIMCIAREMDEDNLNEGMERLNYLHKRLKEFSKQANANAAPVPTPNPNDGWASS